VTGALPSDRFITNDAAHHPADTHSCQPRSGDAANHSCYDVAQVRDARCDRGEPCGWRAGSRSPGVFLFPDIIPEVRASGHEDGHAIQVQPYLPTVPPTFDEPATDDTDPTRSFPPAIWDATGHQEPLTPEPQRQDVYALPLIVERDALAFPKLRLLFQMAPQVAARPEAVQAAANTLWPLELGETIDRRMERSAAAVWRARLIRPRSSSASTPWTTRMRRA